MKQSPLYQRYAFIVLCPAILLMALRLFQRVNRPNAALPLTPTKSLVSNITATTAVSLPQSPLVLPNKAKPIALSTAILALLPAGAEPLAEFDASRLSGCGQETQAISYRLATGGISLAAIGRGKLLWDWQQEHAASKQWVEIRPLLDSELQNILTFLGRDGSGAWWLGVVLDLCRTPYLDVLLPVSGPASLSISLESINPDRPNGEVSYWVVDHTTLFQYRVVRHQAVRKWTYAPARNEVMMPWRQDVTGDGKAELILGWGWSAGDLSDHPSKKIGPYQIFQPDGEGYKLVGEVEPEWQLTDVDGDGKLEFLRPLPADHPTTWKVYRWQGAYFEWSEPLKRPMAQEPFTPDIQKLPAIPTNFYFKRDNALWLWPQRGGALQAVTAIPHSAPHQCDSSSADMQLTRTQSFSPDCKFALIDVSHYIEGSNSAILNRQTGDKIELPNSFVYSRGYSTFAWDAQSRHVIHARADSGAGLYRIDVNSGAQETLLSLNNAGLFYQGELYYGAVSPVVFFNGDVGFTIQSNGNSLYPPRGVYRLTAPYQMTLLAEIPPLTLSEAESPDYGLIQWSADGTMFLYFKPRSYSIDGSSIYYEPPYDTLLLGTTDHHGVWNLNPILGDAQDFGWDP